MGEVMMGSQAKQVGKADLMSPQQMRFLNSLITNLGPQAQGALSGLLEGFSEDNFQKGVVDPAMKTYQQQIIPSIQQRAINTSDSSSSSALNQALVQSSQDLSNVLSGQRMGYQQMYNQQNLGALSQILGLVGQRQFDPIVQGPQEGMLKDLISTGGQLGAAYLMSSKEVKKNIKAYEKSLETLRNLQVKQYDYTVDVEGPKENRVGIIAEDLPCELLGEVNGVKAVDLYGLVSLLINCIKDLDKRLSSIGGNNAYNV